MKRLCEARAYSAKPVAACYWASTTDTPELANLTQDINTEIAIIGAGFTGLSAAHHLAKRGADVTVIEAEFPAFGATGRNGGFCCLGGAQAKNAQLDKRYGKVQRLAYRRSEVAAVGLVKTLLAELNLQADTHSSGETLLAHRASDCDSLKNSRAQIKE
ncbi:MAG: FAD-binding oxidoreductase, partial [Rhodobacteraceae bacterium]|nr:FAD-binding oxidoreductase [Paracoccaceae bacterium]